MENRKRSRKVLVFLLAFSVMMVLVAMTVNNRTLSSAYEPTENSIMPTATETVNKEATATPEPTPIATATATAEPTPTATATATPEPTPIATPEPTPTATATATAEPTPTATATATPEPTPIATPEPTPTATATATAEPTPTATATATPEPTPIATPEPTPIATPEPTPTATATATAEPTPTATATATAKPTPAATATATPEPTPTATATPEPTPTATATPEPTPTPTEDTDRLEAIARLNAAINAEVEGKAAYTQKTWEAYEEALEAAKAIDTDTAATDDINAAAEALENATAGLTKVVPASDIVVSGEDDATEINVGDTLQMSVKVTPKNTTDKKIVWSVVAGTGSATITEDGLLTATSEGTVTVVATNEASGKTVTKTITITSEPTGFTDSQFTYLKGSWKVVNGKLVPVKGGEHRAVLNDSKATDCTIDVTAAFVSGTNKGQRGYGIYYRAAAGKNGEITGYCLQYDPGAGNAFVVRRVVNGREQRAFKRVTFKDVFGKNYDLNAVRNIKIVLNGEKQTIYVDGTKIMEFTDDGFTSGCVGVRTWGDTVAEFIDITVTK